MLWIYSIRFLSLNKPRKLKKWILWEMPQPGIIALLNLFPFKSQRQNAIKLADIFFPVKLYMCSVNAWTKMNSFTNQG